MFNIIETISKVEIEAEGEVNGFFTIHFKDGTKRGGWSCDQGSIEMDDEFDIDEALHKFLFDLWFAMDVDNEYDGRFFATWTPKDGLSPTTKEEV